MQDLFRAHERTRMLQSRGARGRLSPRPPTEVPDGLVHAGASGASRALCGTEIVKVDEQVPWQRHGSFIRYCRACEELAPRR